MKSEAQAARRPGRPKLDRRDEILDAALALYAELGFEKTTLGDVARALGMSPANLYRSFANRREIDAACAARSLGRVEDAAWAAARTAAVDPSAALRRTVWAVASATMETTISGGRLSHLCGTAVRERWPVVQAFMGSLHAVLRHIVAEGQRRGTFRADLALEPTVAALVDALSCVWHPYMLELCPPEGLEAACDRVVDVLLLGLRVPEPAEKSLN